MKMYFIKFSIVLSFQFFVQKCFTQNPDTIYFTDKWQICERSFATFYRIGTAMMDSFIYYSGPVRDYYMNGTLEMEGNYSKTGQKEGVFNFYFPNGQLQASGNVTNSHMYGMWNYYYDNGTKNVKIYYPGDEDSFIVIDYFDSSGKQLAKDGTGMFEMFVTDPSGKMQYGLSGKFTNGQRDGVWNYFGTTPNATQYLAFKEAYNKGKFKRGETAFHFVYNDKPIVISNAIHSKFYTTETFATDEFSFKEKKMDTSQINISKVDNVHGNTRDTIGALRNVEVEAAFPGGDATWHKFLERNLHAEVIENDLPRKTKKFQQTVFIQFVVCTDGTVCEIKTLNDLLPSIKKEAERVIKLTSGHWKPAIYNGRAVKAFRTQPITFMYETD